ncbi:hypothetical protein CVT25_011778 [Psilocybe cyanescens]|uniref:Uncharacterized protein n=1 Tax=Psilocybe cyanescens TaxID=93625 RepID=A0A409WJ85_PSICY|nr:hypothetical protein CVT25_011778 [Psilocybe cyanescens]
MESLNLNTLVNSLPTTQQNAEKELLNDFKAAALSITTLYRSSRKNSKRAYNAGYAAACQDLLSFIQQGVSAGDVGQSPADSSSHAVEGGGMTIGRVMDWTEARVDAIKAREEEEDEDEEREKGGERAAAAVPASRAAPAPPVGGLKSSEGRKPVPVPSSSRVKETIASLPTPNSPASHASTQPPSEPSSPSPPPSATLPRSGTRPSKSRPTPTKESSGPTMQPIHSLSSAHSHSHSHIHSHLSDPFHSSTASSVSAYPETPIVIGAGTKRRHAVMRMLDSSPPTTTISIGGPSSTVSSPGGIGGNNMNYTGTTASSLSKRRTRSSRNLTQLQPHNPNISVIQMSPEAMDVEEDGRERKRVARR